VRKCLYALIIFLILPRVLPAAVIQEEIKDYKKHLEQTKNDLKQVKSQITSEREKIKKEKLQEQLAAKHIQRLDREIDITRRELEVFDNNINVLDGGIKKLDERISEAKNIIEEKKKTVETILRQQYKRRDMEFLGLLLNSGSFSDFIKRYKFVKVLSKKNMQQVNEYADTLRQLEDDRQSLSDYQSELSGLKKDKEGEWKRFKDEKWKKHVYISGIKTDIQKRKRLLSDLEESAKNLSDFMEQIEVKAELQDSDAEQAFANSAGKFPWPVDGGYILAKFGKYKHPKFGSIVNNSGLHIAEKLGAPVYTIFKGTVKYADWFEGYGKMVIIHHGGDYYSIYGHMSKLLVGVGDTVDVKQQIGCVGDTESFFGSELYLEIRKKTTPVDPLKYLRRR
jgi:septal ring factor EnvC (AmiA/AmiB activator)